jgi:FkbM family methyltransferase
MICSADAEGISQMRAARTLAGIVKGAIKPVLPESLILKNLVRREFRQGDAEIRIVHCLCSRSEIAIDVGANRGPYAYVFSRYCDHVLALEPHPLMVKRLRKALPRRVKILNIAASDREGECTFHIPVSDGQDLDTRCSLEAEVNHQFATRTISVERQRLDRLSLEGRAVGVVKIDVEGHELSTLGGMTGMIAQFQPTIIVESEARHHPGAPRNVFEFLCSFGYKGYFIHRGVLRTLDEFSVEKYQAASVETSFDEDKSPDYINNFVFIHPARSDVLKRVKQVFPAPAPSLAVDALSYSSFLGN